MIKSVIYIIYPSLYIIKKQSFDLAALMKIIIKILFFLVYFVNYSYAHEIMWKNSVHSQVKLVSNNTDFAIIIKLKKGWMMYAPNDVGEGKPPEIEIISNNLEDYNIYFPEAKKTIKEGHVSYVYTDEVAIPIKSFLKNASEIANLQIDLKYAVCKEQCMIEHIKYEMVLPTKILNKQAAQIIENAYEKRNIEDNSNFIAIIIYSIIGGFILNLMPCVLPVLSLKIMNIVEQKKKTPRMIKIYTMATILGIMTTFAAIGMVAVIFKILGKNFGIGFHFQEPFFLIAMILILLLMGISLLGVYEIAVPRFILNLLPQNMRDDSIIGSFFTGVIATILASPCTAPYLSIALTYSLTATIAEIFAIFCFIGLGLALPYFIILFFPEMLKILPRPGEWMIKFKKYMAALIFMSVLWLLYILYNQLGFFPSLSVFMLCLLIKFTLENKKYFLRSKKNRLATLLILLIITFILPFKINQDDKNLSTEIDDLWIKFDENNISKYISDNKIIIVDVTANWCITCKMNKIINLNRPFLLKLLKEKKVIGMRADLTNHDDIIYNYMKKHGRNAIPMNVVYGPGAKHGIVLPVEIFGDSLSNSITKAGKN